MARGKKNSVQMLPELSRNEVITWIRSGRMTLDQMVAVLHARGDTHISRSALSRFAQSLKGSVGVLIEWAGKNPKGAARLAKMIEASPEGGFSVYIHRSENAE